MKKSKGNKVPQKKRKIIAIGGGLLRMGETINIDKFIIKESGKIKPKVLFIPTASRDLPAYSNTFKQVYKKLGGSVKIIHLFDKIKPSHKTLEGLIMKADIIYVGGGSFDLMLSAWKKYKIISLIKSAYQQGTILTGLSAGCAVWYEYLVDKEKNKKNHIKKGLGILKGISIPHYKTETPIAAEAFKTKNIITAVEDNCAVIYINENLRGSIPVTKERAFIISPPYAKKKKVPLFFHKPW